VFASLHGKGDLRKLAFEFSPFVEQNAPDTVTFDVSGLDRLFGLPQDIAAAIRRRAGATDVHANLALASNPDAAIYAARGFKGISVLPQGDEAKFLGSLLITLLDPSPELQETLERWGIRRFQNLAALPPLGIAERLGPEGLRLRLLARGEVERKLVLLEEPLRFEDEIELEYPVELLEPLAFVLARLLDGLTTRLATRGLATNELRLALKLETRGVHERTLRLPVPSLDQRAFLKLIQLDLSAHPPSEPVVHVRLEVNPVKPRAAQSGLFIPGAPEPVNLELTLARIKKIVGPENVGSPELLDTHRPQAFQMVSGADPLVRCRPPGRPARASAADRGVRPTFARLMLRVFRPPRAARVEITSGRPSFVAAQGVRGKVLELAGPWRTSGDWWMVDAWSRDEWDMALSDGALYRMYCEVRGWFVEGTID
jgi:protein ImuB